MKMKTVLLGLSMVAGGVIAHADPTPANVLGYVSGSVGYADPTSINGRFGYGGDAGMLFSNGMMGSVYYRGSADKDGGRTVNVQHYGLGFDWSLAPILSGPLGGFRAGVKVGASTMDAGSNGTVQSYNDTELAFGPTLGYDLFHLPYNFSVGAEASLLFTMGPNQYSTLYVLANVKYWF